jgi:hypothetical protein
MIKLIIMEGRNEIRKVMAPAVPRVGEYIYHDNMTNVMTVRTVTWKLFSPGEPYAEIHVGY